MVAVSIFGPRKIIRQLICNESNSNDCKVYSSNEELDLEQFLQAYKEIFIPWCLEKNSYSTSSRLDLLLALLDNECFLEQWNNIIIHATNLENQDSSHFSVLTMLMEKTREEVEKRKLGADINHLQGSLPENWHHKLLDSAALFVARSLPLFGTSGARFLW